MLERPWPLRQCPLQVGLWFFYVVFSDSDVLDVLTLVTRMFCLFSVEEKVEGMLYQMMAGACETLKESNCALVGGHTAEGKTVATFNSGGGGW